MRASQKIEYRGFPVVVILQSAADALRQYWGRNEDVPASPSGDSENAFSEAALETDLTLTQLRL
jgi:hypothetical protein